MAVLISHIFPESGKAIVTENPFISNHIRNESNNFKRGGGECVVTWAILFYSTASYLTLEQVHNVIIISSSFSHF